MLGSHVYETLKNKHVFELISSSRTSSTDVEFNYRIMGLGSLLKKLRPNIIINCIAVTSPSSSILKSFKVNGILPIHLAILALRFKAKVVHISTNAVFSGTRSSNLESTFSIPHSRYGVSKLVGDLALFNSLVIRTSFVGFSNRSSSAKGLVNELVHLPVNSSYQIQENFKWNGITAGALSEFIFSAIKLQDFPKGIIHLGTIEKVSRLQLVELLLIHLGRFDISVTVSSSEVTRNLSLDSKKGELISQIWINSCYGFVPTLNQLIQELPVSS